MIQIETGCNSAQEIMGLTNGIESIDIAFSSHTIDHFELLLKVLCVKEQERVAIIERMYELTGTKKREPISFKEALRQLQR